MTPDRPKLRDDLQFTTVGDEVVIFDPILNVYHQVGLIHQLILQKLDGRRSVHEVVHEISREAEAELPIDVLRSFLSQARTLHLLDAGSTEAFTLKDGLKVWRMLRAELDAKGFTLRSDGDRPPREPERRSRLEVAQLFESAVGMLKRGNPIQAARHLHAVMEVAPDNARAAYLLRALQRCVLLARRPEQSRFMTRVPLGNPDRLLAALVNRLGFLVSGWTYACLVVWFCAGAALIAPQLERVAWDVGQIPRVVAAHPWLAFGGQLVFVIIAVGHELCHGIACRRYGGRVPEVGLLVYLLIFPTAYCDTSATYTFKKTSHRIGVSLAGIAWQMFLYLPAVALYLNTSAGTPLHTLLLLLVISCWSTVLTGLVPFMKGDGYYVISDALKTPNLFEVSKRYWVTRLEWLILGLQPRDEEPLRHLWAVRIYGLLNIITMIMFSFSAYFTVTVPMMTTLLRGPGLLIASVPIVFLLFAPVWRFGAALISRRDEVKRSPRALVSLGVALALLAFAVLVPLPYSLTVPCAIGDSETTVVHAEADGIVAEWTAREGEVVREGQVVVRLETAVAEVQLVRAETRLRAAESDVKALEAGPSAERVRAASAVVAAVSRVERTAKRRLERHQSLSAQGLLPTDNLEQSAMMRERARTLTTAARGQLAVVAERPREEVLRAAAEAVMAARAEVEIARQAMSRLEVRAPRAGRVTWARVGREDVSPTRRPVKKGEELLRIGGDEVVAELDAPIEYAQLFSTGQQVHLRLDGVEGPAIATRLASTEVARVGEAAQGPGPGLIMKSLFGSRAMAEHTLLKFKTEPISTGTLRQAATGRARIELARRTLLSQLGWQLRYFTGYYWWSLW